MKREQLDHRRGQFILHWTVFILLGAVSVGVLLFYPIPRQIGLTFRQSILILPIVFLLPFLAFWVRSQIGKAIAYAVMFAAILLPLSGLWNSGGSEQYIWGGVIPWSDGFTLHLNSLRFLYGSTMGQSTALRPLSVLFYSFFLYGSGNNFILLHTILIVLIAILIVANTDLIAQNWGVIPSSLFYLNAFFYIRGHTGEYMTEVFGFIAGMLSCYLLLSGILGRKKWSLVLGFALLSLALNARPGPMFVFPFLGLWFFFVFLQGERKKLLWGAIALFAMLSGFLLNRAAVKIVYHADSIPNRQMAEIIYGLCLGGKDSYDVMGLPEMVALNDSKTVFQDTFHLCRNVLRAHPENAWISLKEIWGTLVFDPLRGAFSYFNGTSRAEIIALVRFGLMFLWLMGLVFAVRVRKSAVGSFFIAFAIGILLTQFIVAPYTTFRMRYHAAVIWFPGLLTGLGAQSLLGCLTRKPTDFSGRERIDHSGLAGLAVMGFLFFAICILSPFLIKRLPLSIPEPPALQCQLGEELLFTRVDRGSYLYLLNQDQITEEHYPNFRLPYVRQHFHDTASVEMFPFTDAIDQPTAVFRGLDFDTFGDVLVFSPYALLEGKTGFAVFCGKFVNPPILRQDRFFLPTQVEFISY